MLKKALRLTAREIESLSQGKSVFGTLISMRFVSAPRLKFAVSVSKKVAARAVDRNSLRRKGYKAVQSVQGTVIKPAYIMLMPKKECMTVTSADMVNEIESLLKRAGLSA